MPFNVRLVAQEPLSPDALTRYFERRPHYVVDGKAFRYENPETGAAFAFRPLEEDGGGVMLTIDVPRAPYFALEAELEASALAAELYLRAAEQEKEGDGAQAPMELVREYARVNAAAHEQLLEAESEPQELPTAVLLSAWTWNLQRPALEAAFRGDVLVPRVAAAVHPETGQTSTVAALVAGRPALVPQVDLLVWEEGSSTSWVAWRDVAHLLEPIGVRSARFRYPLEEGLREAGLRHYDLTNDVEVADAIRAASRCDGTAPRMVPMTDVYARELARLAMGLGDIARSIDKRADAASRFPRECRGFLRTRNYELTRVLGGYTWLSPWKLEAIAFAERPDRRDVTAQSPAKSAVVAGVGAGGVVFFDVESGRRIREIRGDIYAGTSIAISEDGKTLAIGNELGSIEVFDVDLDESGFTLEKRRTYGGQRADGGASPHGQALGVSSDGAVVIGAVGDDIVVLRDGEEPTTFRATGPVCASGDLLRVWTGTELVEVATEKSLNDLGIDPRTPRIPALSPDGRHLVFATSKGELLVVRMEDGAILALVARKDAREQPAVARFIAFTPDGRRLVVGDSTGLEVRRALTLELEKSYDMPAWDAAVSSDAIYRVVDDRIWTQPLDGPAPPVNDGPITQLFHSARGPIALATSAPGEGLTGGRAVLWHLPSGAVLRATDRLCPDRVNLTPDGRYLCLATESSLRVLDVGTLGEVAVVEPLGKERYVRPIDLDASPDGEHVLACLEDGFDRMVSIKTGLDLWKADLGIRCATFTADGLKIVAGDASRLRVIDAATGSVEKEVALEDPRADGEHVLLGNGERAVRVAADVGVAVVDFEAETADVYPFPFAREVIAASPDGRIVAVLVDGESDVELSLWSVEARAEVDRISLASAEDTPVSAAFSPDGKSLLVGTSRGALLVFT